MMPERKNMYAERTFYQKSGDKSYLVIRSGEEPELPYQINMIKYNNIGGLLPVQFFIEDGEYRYFYDITCRESIADRMKQRRYSIQEIRTVMSCLYRCVQQLEEYLLDTNCLILEPEYIFTEKDCFNILFCFYQDKRESFKKSLEKLFDYFLNQLDYQDEKTVVLMYGLYQKSREGHASLYELMKQFCEIQGVEKEKTREECNLDIDDAQDTNEETNINSEVMRRSRKKESEKKIRAKRLIPYIPDMIGSCGIAGILWIVSRHHAQMSGKEFMLWMFAAAGILAVCGIISTFLSGVLNKEKDERQCAKSIRESFQKKVQNRQCESELNEMQNSEWGNEPVNAQNHECRSKLVKIQEQERKKVSKTKIDYEEDEGFDEFRFEAESGKPEVEKAGIIPATVIMSEPELFRAHNPVLISKDREKFQDIVLKDREMMIGKVRGIADICLEGKSISRVHARIRQDQEGCSVTDLGSTNGTFINGVRLGERQKKYLQKGDEVRFAEAVFVFQTEETEILHSQQLSDVI